jgi:hypothetical protein
VFKRVVWMGMGFGAGVGATVWTEVKLRRTAARFTPAAIGDEVSGRVRSLGVDVREALREGRAAMVAREAELRAEHAPLRLPGAPLSLPGVPLRGMPLPLSGAETASKVIELSAAKTRPRHPRTPERRRSPAVPWSDHGHERPSARLS